MKKAKLMLAIIACLTLVGGVFAFKENRLGAGNVYISYANVGTISYCSLRQTLSITTSPIFVLSTIYTGTGQFNVCLGKTITFVITVA